MRLVHVIAEMAVGGAERIVHRLAAAGLADGHEVTVVSGGGPWVARLVADGIPHRHLPDLARAATTPQALLPLRAALRDLRPDVLHTHNVRATVAAFAACRLAGVRPRVLTTVHGLTARSYRPAARALRVTSDRVVGCAPAITAALVRGGLPAARTTTVLNGAALEPAGTARCAALAARLDLPEGPLIVGVGRLVPEKRWDVLIDALAGSAGPSAVVAGHGPLREELERRAGEVAAPVRFLGAIDDVPALLGLARCYVQTSDSEGLPLALLEALSLGLPAVVTAVGGVRDVVPDDAARLVAPGDAGVVRRALSDVLDDPEGAAALGAAARRAAAGWRPERMVGAYRDAYAALLSA